MSRQLFYTNLLGLRFRAFEDEGNSCDVGLYPVLRGLDDGYCGLNLRYPGWDPSRNLLQSRRDRVGRVHDLPSRNLSYYQDSVSRAAMASKKARRRPRVMVLRIGHRIPRDERVTTHVCLTARALGADGVYVSDVQDRELAERINRVREEFGGDFTIQVGGPWRSTVMEWKRLGGRIVHLTAYGIPLPKIVARIRRSREDKLVIVGAEKVPGEIFRLADWNVAVTNQPISEVSALGIFLDWFFKHSGLEKRYSKAKLQIVPTAHGKTVVRN